MSIVERIITAILKFRRLFSKDKRPVFVDITKTVDGVVELYLRRWFICSTPNGNVYLHRIVRSDSDPDPHDHPWDFKTLVIRTGYDDVQYSYDSHHPMGRWRSIRNVQRTLSGKVYARKARHCHRVKLLRNKDGKEKAAWTLVFMGKYDKEREWGFVKEDGTWVYWRTYLGVSADAENIYDRIEKQT